MAMMKPMPSRLRMIPNRDPDVIEVDFGGIGGPVPHLVFVLPHRYSRQVHGDDKCGKAAGAAGFVGHGEDDSELGNAGVGDERLRSVEQVVISLPDRRCLDGRIVRPGFFFGQGEAGEGHLSGQGNEEFLFLLFAPNSTMGVRGQGIGHDGRVHSGATPCQFLADDDIGQGRESGAVVFGRNAGSQESGVKRLLHDIEREFVFLVVFGRAFGRISFSANLCVSSFKASCSSSS